MKVKAPPGSITLTCLGIGLQKVVTPQPVRGSSSPRGPRRSSRLDLPRDPILGRLSCLDLPGDSISRRLSHLSLPGDLHPDPGIELESPVLQADSLPTELSGKPSKCKEGSKMRSSTISWMVKERHP